MDLYKVEHSRKPKTGGRATKHTTQVSASNREAAVYLVFDETNDLGMNVVKFGDVHVFYADKEEWVLIPSHKQLSKAFG
jgi:hypothetical protein